MEYGTSSVTEHIVTFTDVEAARLGQWLLTVCDAMHDDMLARIPCDQDIQDLIGDLANHLNGVN